MNRKQVLTLAAVLTLAFVAAGLSGCGSSDTASDSTTTTLDDAELTTSTVGSSGERVVMVSDGEALLKNYFKTIDELNSAEAVDAIVRGQVIAVQDTWDGYVANRMLTVKVKQTYKGDVADEIIVREDGGIIPLKDILPLMEGHYDPSTLSQDDIDHGLVDFTFMGASHTEVGDKVILYLRVDSDPSLQNTYVEVMSVFGRFKLDEKKNEYMRPEMKGAPSFETKSAKDVMEAKLKKLNSE